MTPYGLWMAALFSEEVEGSSLSLDPTDSGNWTSGICGQGELRGSRYGISARAFPAEDIAGMTLDRASVLAKSRYWDPHNLDAFPAPIAILMADSFYNGGHPVIWLQQTLGVLADGDFGPRSRGALAADTDTLLLLQRFTGERLAYMASLGQPAEMAGWGKRCGIMLCIAAQAAGGLPAVAFA